MMSLYRCQLGRSIDTGSAVTGIVADPITKRFEERCERRRIIHVGELVEQDTLTTFFLSQLDQTEPPLANPIERVLKIPASNVRLAAAPSTFWLSQRLPTSGRSAWRSRNKRTIMEMFP